ncbi:thioredoxin domain-containing protein [Pedobacter antarcticus]|uniref:thioredoxin domain-containing protein n=1 Tax=Pedobacter antarcticus TaxID=34086 RepID=UPI00088719BD|nr:thioredoxin domain-containing protein [Pedobacter antarcticus]SDM27377.1 thioredoxin [Pedobacter antarcticus]
MKISPFQKDKSGRLWFVFQLLILCFITLTSSAQTGINVVSAEEFQLQLNTSSKPQLIDVRTPDEFKTSHLKNAVNYNFNAEQFKDQLAKLDKNAPVYIYCKGGGRSAAAVKQMEKLGFTQVTELKGGIMSWEQNDLPVETGNVKKGDSYLAADFNELLAAHQYLLVDFYAEWCLPCKKMEPALAKLKTQYQGDVAIERVDVDKAKDLAKTLKIEGLPAVAVYRDGVEIKRVTGYQSEKELIGLIELLKK